MIRKKGRGMHQKLMTIYKKLFSHFGPQHWWPGETPFEVAIGAILTQNTAWSNVVKAINNLKREKLLDPVRLYHISEKRLAHLIKPSGYFNTKSKRLKSFMEMFYNDYHADIGRMISDSPDNLRERLLSVKGIGSETADSILLYACGYPVFVVDAYTKRILTRHGIIPEEYDYDDIQGIFHSSLPRDASLFNEYHALIVRVGKEYCRRIPRCEGCPLKEL